MINYLHSYVNDRPGVDWNTCGMAAIATITDYWGLNPYGLVRLELDPTNNLYYWDDGEGIDAIISDGKGPDVVFGWDKTGGGIRDALNSYGLNSSVGYSGFASAGWEGLWQALQDYLSVNRPVPVMVDLGGIGGPWWTVHWAIAYKVDGDRIFLGNCPWNPEPSVNDFLHAWHCWFLPYGFNHCGVYT